MHTVLGRPEAGLVLTTQLLPKHIQEHGEVDGPRGLPERGIQLVILDFDLVYCRNGGWGWGSRGKSISCPGGLVVGTGTVGLPPSVILQVSPPLVAMGTVCKHSRFSWETGCHCPPLGSLSAHLGWVSCVFLRADHRAEGQNTPPM